MDNFLVQEVIGRGRYSILETIRRKKYSAVYKGQKIGSVRKFIALKSVDKSPEGKLPLEVKIHQSLVHSNVVKFLDWVETSTHWWVILEYCFGGDLQTLLEQEGALPEDSVHDFAYDLVGGLRYLHGMGIVHCDLKPSNILLDGNGTAKLSDFGLSRKSSEIPSSSLVPKSSKIGSPSYMAPELFHEGGVHSYASDLWSLGCVLYECYVGKPPFIGEASTDLIQSILTDPVPPLPRELDGPFADLVSRLLIKDPQYRIQWSEICSHDFWGFSHQLSPVDLPAQPPFDKMIQQQLCYRTEGIENRTPRDTSNEAPEGENLLRLSRKAFSNIQRENMKEKYQESDVEIEKEDTELNFNEYREDKMTISEDENLSSTRVIEDDEFRRSTVINLWDVLWHRSDLSVLPVMPSDKKQSDVLHSAVPFDAIPSSDFVKLPKVELDDFTKSIVTTLNGKTPISEKKEVIRYLEMLSTNGEAAKILINSSMLPFLVKMLRQSKVCALRVQVASVIGLLIRYSTFIKDDLSNSGILEALKECVEDRQEKEVRRFSMAALGELLSHISSTQKESPSTTSWWQVSDALISVVTSLLGKGEDDLTQLYALRTIANMSSQGVYWSTRFTTKEDVIRNLCYIFRAPGKEETHRLTAGSCLVRLVCFTPSTINDVMKELTFTETIAIAISKKKNPKQQQICFNFLNMALLDCEYLLPDLALLVEDKKLVPNLVTLIEDATQVVCGKSLVFVMLLCMSSTRWLGEFFFSGKFLSIVDRLVAVKEKVGDYMQQCLEAFLRGVVAVISRLLKDVLSDVQTGTTSVTNLERFPVILKLLRSSSFKHEVVNADVLQQLKDLLKLVESSFQGKDAFHTSVLNVLQTITQDFSLIEQNQKIFVHEILPSVSIICRDEKAKFDCLKIWFEVVGSLIHGSSAVNRVELGQICIDHFLPLYPELMKASDPIPFYADQLRDLLVGCQII